MTQTGFAYLFGTIFCALFGAVYEHMSHGVFSYYMLYAFAIPLVGGVLSFFVLGSANVRYPNRVCCNLYHCGVVTVTVGSLVQGALEIYGTTNRLVGVYWIVGGCLLLASVLGYGIGIWHNAGRARGEATAQRH